MIRRSSARFTAIGLPVFAWTLALLSNGCVVAPEIGDTYAVNTPTVYTENRVYFVGDPLAIGAQCCSTPTPIESAPYRPLVHPYEIPESLPLEQGDDRSTDAQSEVARGRPFDQNDPVGVIVRGVRLPEDLKGRRDIAVILDLITKGSDKVQSIVVFYQRDVPGGQMLNFANLLVYYDPQWDGVTPPYFRLRVLDVRAERNRQTRLVLDEASALTGIVGGIVPHPLIPVVAKAVQAASLVLSNSKNQVLIDYTVQFYSEQQRAGSGGADLGLLRTGEFLAIGRPAGQDASFWQESLVLDRRSLRICERADTNNNVLSPYFSLVLIKARAQVPSIVMDRSKALVDLLSTPSGKGDLDLLESVSRSLASSAQAYVAEQRLMKYQSLAELGSIQTLLAANEQALQDKEPPILNKDEVARLVFVVNQIVLGKYFASAAGFVQWWDGLGDQKGHLVPDKSARFGFKWAASTSNTSQASQPKN